MNAVLDASLWYLKEGISVIPIEPVGKKPLVAWEQYQKRLPTEAEVKEWFEEYPNRNIGVVCGSVSGNLCIFDFDSFEAFDKVFSFKERFHLKEQTRVVQTGKGIHLYFRTREPVKTEHFHDIGIPVDLQGEGSYCVATPSTHQNGKTYRVISKPIKVFQCEKSPVEDLKRKLAEAYPEKAKKWFLHFAEKKKVEELLNGVPEGNRNASAFDLALYYKNKEGLGKEGVLEKLREWNAKNPKPLEERELTSVVEGVFKKGYKGNRLVPQGEEFFQEKSFVPSRVSEVILREMAVKTLKDSEEEFYFDTQEGIWKPAEPKIKQLTKRLLGEKSNKYRVSEVVFDTKVSTFQDRKELEPPINLVPLENGILDLNTLTLKPFSPEVFFTTKLGVSYNPTAKCPNFEKFLSEVVSKEDGEMVLEFFAYTLYRDYPIHTFFIFSGEGGNGKSTCIRVLERFLENQNISSLSLQQLSQNRFASSGLYRKYANLHFDIPDKALYDTGLIKQATGNDLIEAEVKYGKPFKFRNHAKFLFSANKVPDAKDNSPAWYRRTGIVQFLNTFEGTKCDTNLIEKISSPEELSGILNLALPKLKPLLERGGFAVSKTIEQKKKDYIFKSNSVKAFSLTCIKPEPDSPNSEIGKDKLYYIYLRFCKDKKLRYLDKTVFGKKLIEQLGDIEDTRSKKANKRSYSWVGVELNEEGLKYDIETPEDKEQTQLEGEK